jgi:hypothetical protein
MVLLYRRPKCNRLQRSTITFPGGFIVPQLVKCREEKRLQRLHLLVIDEFGYVPFSKAGAELLFEVISRAY